MTEGINVPCVSGDSTKSILQPSVSNRHLVNHILVIRCCLVRHAPTSVQELNLPILVKSLHPISLCITCLIPPSVQESHFNDGKLISSVLAQLFNDRVNCVLDSSQLSLHVASVVIIVYCLEPSNVIVRVGNQVDCDLRVSFLLQIGMVMMRLHHFLVLEALCAFDSCHSHKEKPKNKERY